MKNYFSFFPIRENYPVFLINDNNTKEVPIKITFPDFFRFIGLSYPGSNDSSFYYENIQILDGERPDQLSYRLYNNMSYYWTFFLINENLRLGENLQWPLSRKQLERKMLIDFEGQTIITYNNKNITPLKNPIVYSKRKPLTGKFQLGERVKGLISNVEGTIINIRPKYGQIRVNDISIVDKAFFQQGESIQGMTSGDVIICDSALLSYAAVYRYIDPETGRDIDNKNFIFIDETAPTTGLDSISFKDHLEQTNEQLRMIRVLKKTSIQQFVQNFSQLINRERRDIV
jgi:hypothetical protein